MALALCGFGLTGCASNPPGTPQLARTLPDTCEQILAPVPLPPVKPTDDARVAFLKDDAALAAANSRIAAGHDCNVDLRQRYAGARKEDQP